MIVEYRDYQGVQVACVDLPSALPSLPPNPRNDGFTLNASNYEELKLKQPDDFLEGISWNHNPRSMEFRRIEGALALDIAVFPPIRDGTYHLEAAHTRYSILTKGNKVPVSSLVRPTADCMMSNMQSISPHGAPCVLIEQDGEHVYVLRLADGYHGDTTWVKLKIPKELDGWNDRSDIAAGFDTLQGRLVLVVDSSIYVLEY